MKKKLLSVLLTMAMTATLLVGCSTPTETKKEETEKESTNQESDTSDNQTEDENEEKGYICFAISYTGNDFMQGLATNFESYFEEKGFDVDVASADGDATTQIEQIENFVTMGADLVVVMGVDPTGLSDVCKRAVDAGTKVVAFTTDVGEEAQSCYVGSASESEIGEGIAQLGSEWIDTKFKDAGDGEIEVAVYKYEGTPEAADRSKGMEAIENNPKVKVNYVTLGENTLDAAQETTENLFQTNPDTKAILCYNSGMSNGVNAYAMSGGSLVENVAEFATFGSDVSGEVMANIEASKTDGSVVRGVISLGDYDTMFADISVPIELLMSGKECEKAYYGKIELIKAY